MRRGNACISHGQAYSIHRRIAPQLINRAANSPTNQNKTNMTVTQQQRPLPLMSPFMTKKQAAHYLGVSVFFIEHLIKTGKLRASRPSYKILRLHQRDLDALMEKSAT